MLTFIFADTMATPRQSRLLQSTVLDGAPEEREARLEAAYKTVTRFLQDQSDREVGATLIREAGKQHGTICSGLLVAMLSEPERCTSLLSHLQYAVTDGPGSVVAELTVLVAEWWGRLREACQQQVVWLVRELVKMATSGVDSVVWQLLRQLAAGTNRRNLWLAEQLLRLAEEQKQWLLTQPQLLAGMVYCLLRQLEDHCLPPSRGDPRQERGSARNLEQLRDREASLAVGLAREGWGSVLVLGRDLVRALQQVAKVPQVADLWQQMLDQPDSLGPGWGLESLLRKPTPRIFLALRVTPQMERKLVFITEQVPFGQQGTYENWFQRSHLGTVESQSLRSDLVRFLTCVLQPSNEVLRSSTTPRWAVVSSLLTSCTSQVTSANCKLALFYDWLFFDPAVDSIMCIEPAALLMYKSAHGLPQMLATLLDFLLRLLPALHPPATVTITACVLRAWTQLLISKVLPSLDFLFGRSLSFELQRNSITRFGSLRQQGERKPLGLTMPHLPVNDMKMKRPDEAVFSDSEDSDEEILTSTALEEALSPTKYLPELLKLTEQLKGAELEQQRQLVTELASTLNPDLPTAQALVLAERISVTLTADFTYQTSGTSPPSRPIFSFFPPLCRPEGPPNSLFLLLTSLANLEPRLGYYLLHFLTTAQEIPEEDKICCYTKFCQMRDLSCEAGLLVDLRHCQNEDVSLLIHLVPHLYQLLPQATLGSVELLYLVVSSVDSGQLQDLVQQVVGQRLVLLDQASCQPVLQASLLWETFEQLIFWQLYLAHELPLATLLKFLSILDTKHHGEAATNVIYILKKKQPTVEILKHLFQRSPHREDLLLPTLCYAAFGSDTAKIN